MTTRHALQEVGALEELSNALVALLKSLAMRYVQTQLLKRTILASLMNSLGPIAWYKDNPWMNAKALAVKAGAVLGDLQTMCLEVVQSH